jgi:uncharacterized protein
MKKFFRFAVAALVLAPTTSAAQDFDAGWAAFNSGDYATALREWTPLAKQGDDRAQFNLGSMYHTGRGVWQDHVEAARWYRLAAEQGNANAQYNLGNMYNTGRGVPKDDVTAHMWLSIAAKNGTPDTFADAAMDRAFVEIEMPDTDISEAQRRARECINSGYQDCD